MQNEQQPDSLARALLLLWAEGELSAAGVQRLAHAAVLDGLQNIHLYELAACGTWGSNVGNCQRDLKRTFGKLDLPEACLFKAPCKDPKSNPAFCFEACAINLPCLLLSNIAAKYQAFQELFAIDKLEAFWSNVKDDDPHWVRLERSSIDPKTCIPVWVHGDGVEYQDRDSLMVLQLGALNPSKLRLEHASGMLA